MNSTESKRDMSVEVRMTRKLLGLALGVELGIKDFGQMLGYEGKNVFTSAQRLEKGGDVSGVLALRLSDLLQAASLNQQELIVIPEWVFEAPADEENDDGSTLYLTRLWFPRLRFAATVQAGPLLIDLGYSHIGYIKTNDFDFEEHDVYCLAQDILPNPDWYSRFYEEAVNLLAAEANRCLSDL